MDYKEFTEIVKNYYKGYISDETIIDYYCGDEEQIAKCFLQVIQAAIKSKFIIQSEKEHIEALNDYSCDMEGLEY